MSLHLSRSGGGVVGLAMVSVGINVVVVVGSGVAGSGVAGSGVAGSVSSIDRRSPIVDRRVRSLGCSVRGVVASLSGAESNGSNELRR